MLLPFARALREVKWSLTRAQLEAIVARVPDAWLEAEPGFATPAAVREAYVRFFEVRLAQHDVFLEEALRARAQLV